MTKILAYDLGTGGNKASLYETDGTLLAACFEHYDTQYPGPGLHEQRPEDWWQAVVRSTRRLFEETDVDPSSIACLAISGHSLGCVPLDAEGKLLRESTPIWSDKRATAQAERFFQSIDPDAWYLKTGNGFPAPHYTAFKVMWYQDNEPEMFAQIDKIIGTKDYVNFKMTGRVATDFSYASGSGVYSLTDWKYDDELIAASGLPASLFPEIVPSTEVLGRLSPEAALELGLSQNVQVMAGGVDNSCMALGARNTAAGRLYASLGSSSWIAVSDDKPLLDTKTKPYVFTHVMPGMFTSAIGVFSTGTTFRWIRDQFCRDLIAKSEEADRSIYELMIEEAAGSPVGANGLLHNPSMAGGSSLEASPNIRGAFLNLDLGHTRADVIRAVMEGIALNLRTTIDALRDLSDLSDRMVTVGGGSLSKAWRQIYADALRIEIEKTNIGQDAAALGAAAVAAVGAGLWPDFSRIDEIHQTESIQTPNEENAKTYDELKQRFVETAKWLSKLGDEIH